MTVLELAGLGVGSFFAGSGVVFWVSTLSELCSIRRANKRWDRSNYR